MKKKLKHKILLLQNSEIESSFEVPSNRQILEMGVWKDCLWLMNKKKSAWNEYSKVQFYQNLSSGGGGGNYCEYNVILHEFSFAQTLT